ncbi:MAG TPA: hypothetical protein VEY30_12750, partial [Myxococcaceae bacterium]|nr:hypothetical protein [Myxococcaceae bacterium]
DPRARLVMMVPSSLIADPDLAFAALDDRLSSLGWELGEESQEPPPLPGEPLWCVYRHSQADALIHYSFNPAVNLRVMQFRGADAAAQWSLLSQSLPVLKVERVKLLLSAVDIRQKLLGIFAAPELGERSLLPQIRELTEDADARVAGAAAEAYERMVPSAAEQVVRMLVEEKKRAPDRSVVFAHLPDVEQRRQVLRWLIRDQKVSNLNVDQVLRTALYDADPEVRVTAVLAAAQLQAREVLDAVRTADIPTSSRHGADARDRFFYQRIRELVLKLLEAGTVKALDTPEGARLRPLIEALTEGPNVGDDASLLLYALTTPLELGEPPSSLPEGVVQDGDEYRLSRSRLSLSWVAPVEHWLSEGEGIRRAQSSGYFISTRPLSQASAQWAQLPFPGPMMADSHAGEPHLCNLESAQRIVVELSRIEGLSLRLPSGDEWEMGVRGPDGRRFPWGNAARPSPEGVVSPWGLERAVGYELQWTRDFDASGAPVVVGGSGFAECARRQTQSIADVAAVRLCLQ